MKALISGVILLSLAACQPSTDATRVVGQLESDRIEMTAEMSETVLARKVIEGAAVQAGDSLLQLDDRRALARLRESEAMLAQNQARVAELTRGPRSEQIVAAQANVDGAVKDLQFRRTELERAESLLERNLASEDLRDRARAALDSATANLQFSRARLSELLNGTTSEELEQAQATVRIIEAQLDRLRIDHANLELRAPVTGVVDRLLFEVGERPPLGKPVLIMLSGAQPHARVYIPEAFRVSVSPGREVTVYVDGLDRPLKGRVRWVASDATFTPYFALTEHDRGRLTFEAKIDIDYSSGRLPDGVPVEVEL